MTQEMAQRLYDYRKQSGYSQEELADHLGVSRQAVSKWERGEASPDTDNLIALADLYGITLDELIKGGAQAQSQERTVRFEGGIYVDDPKHGTHVHVGKQGVYVQADSTVYHDSRKDGPIAWWYAFPFPVFAIAAYLVFGLMNICGGWAAGWLVLLTIPLYYSLVSAIARKNPANFAYPVLVAMLYLYVGLFHHIWHPSWWVFLTIPLYYWICGLFGKTPDEDKEE